MSLTLTNIPAIMRAQRWGNGARLMDIWFSRPSAIAPAYGAPDTTTIRMDTWALTFPRARNVYDQLMRDRIWANPAGQAEVVKMLRRKSLLVVGGTFGNLGLPVQSQDRDYVTQRVVEFALMYDPLDDMSAALANFAFRVLVAGSVAAGTGGTGYRVTISEVGVYIRDSYDFVGFQPLGFWDDSTNTVQKGPFWGGVPVFNSDFQDWRTAHSAGGDFLVYSDIKRTPLAVPDTFTV
jgi:Family of unknown function (DUF6402)